MAGKDHLKGIHKTRHRGGDIVRRQPAGHLYREGDKQYHVADHRRVKGIVAQSTVQLFGNNHRKHRTEHDHPPRRKRRNTDGQQQARQQSGVIAENTGDVHLTQLQHQRFGRYGAGTAQC